MNSTLCQLIVVSATAFAGCALTACSSTPSTTTATELCGDTTVSLGDLGPASAPPAAASVQAGLQSQWSSGDVYLLGAGDALGRQIFTRYVASLRAAERYATGASDFPAQD